jgi:HSP20 family protein
MREPTYDVETLPPPPAPAPTLRPDVDIKSAADHLVLWADLPGVAEADLDIEVVGDRLKVSGRRRFEPLAPGEIYFACERPGGEFARTFPIPAGVDAEHIRGELRDGVLKLVMVKTAVARRRLDVNDAGAAVSARPSGGGARGGGAA